jgi:hypothetical protein
LSYGDKRYKLVDLPGTYSLLSTSAGRRGGARLHPLWPARRDDGVVDATRLERNLNLALQVLEITDRVVVCLNLMDEAKRHGLQVDERRLARDLGVPVVPTAARQGEGVQELLQGDRRGGVGRFVCKAHRVKIAIAGARIAPSDQLVAQIETPSPACPTPAGWRCVCSTATNASRRAAAAMGTLGHLPRKFGAAVGSGVADPAPAIPWNGGCEGY